MPGEAAPRPMDGLLVLDFSMMIAGPLAGMICADLGADVIKVEPPSGDGSRDYFSVDPNVRFNAMTQAYNRGKRSLAVDLGDDDDYQLVRRIAARADVVIEAFRPGVMGRLRLDYDTLRADNERLIYASISGFGQRGPDAQRPGFDTALQAESGLMYITGEPDGQPQRIGTQIVDAATGHVTAQAILGALLNRERHGVGCRVETSLLDTAMSLQAHNYTEYLTVGVPMVPGGRHPIFTTPSGLYPTADGEILFSANTTKHWAALCQAMEADDIASNPAYADQAKRVAARDELIPRIAEIMQTRTTDEWVQRFRAGGIVYGQVRDYPSVEAWEQFTANELLFEARRGQEVTRTLRQPVRYSAFDYAARAGAPGIGADSEPVRAEFPSPKTSEK